MHHPRAIIHGQCRDGRLIRRCFRTTSSSLDTYKDDTSFVRIVEVGPRDGLQNEPHCPTTNDKIVWIQQLVQAGCRHVEVGSFVSPKRVPSMADSAAVLDGLHQQYQQELLPSSQYHFPLTFSTLVPNVQGLEMALQHGSDEIAIFGSASEAFSQHNIGCSIDESMERFRLVLDTIHSKTKLVKPLRIRGYVSCVIACPYQGPVAPTQVAHVVQQMAALGCDEISLGDTIGVGTPGTTLPMLQAVQDCLGHNTSHTLRDSTPSLAVHFHDTYGQALANIVVSLERGISVIDSSVAGLGGCPYAPGASGNVATEDVVYMLEGMGRPTGIDLEKLVDAGLFICQLLGQESKSRAANAILAKRRREQT